MSITRINEFQAKEAAADELWELLDQMIPVIEASEGCRSARLLRHHDDATNLLVIEVWESIQAHQASVKNIAPEDLQKAMQLLAGPPKGRYFVEGD